LYGIVVLATTRKDEKSGEDAPAENRLICLLVARPEGEESAWDEPHN
jgi:hypothetical protein